mmetsp:Transcript_118673/g.215834  ORF Transcript_118673/g.215834 Transcript_118673/m.215834 type:complete len:272 (-) Transcript_118673:1818-2633(-)
MNSLNLFAKAKLIVHLWGTRNLNNVNLLTDAKLIVHIIARSRIYILPGVKRKEVGLLIVTGNSWSATVKLAGRILYIVSSDLSLRSLIVKLTVGKLVKLPSGRHRLLRLDEGIWYVIRDIIANFIKTEPTERLAYRTNHTFVYRTFFIFGHRTFLIFMLFLLFFVNRRLVFSDVREGIWHFVESQPWCTIFPVLIQLGQILFLDDRSTPEKHFLEESFLALACSIFYCISIGKLNTSSNVCTRFFYCSSAKGHLGVIVIRIWRCWNISTGL